MTPERWADIKAAVGAAIEMPRAERAAFLERVCAGDPEMRREVESLLAASDQGGSLPDLHGAVASVAHDVLSESATDTRTILETALSDRFEVVRPLGRGGMGDVFLARERALDRLVAIKVLRPELATAPASRERFRREARIAAQLSHPGILRLYSFGEVAGLWYFVMDYVRGESLAERLRLEGKLPWSDTHRIMMELADSLDAAHRHGIVHRDIKPGNILLDDETGRSVLADFGISKIAGLGDSLTATGTIVGTPDYMSPEQILASSEVDERSDIYSLGAVAYTMLAGHAPFEGTTSEGEMYRRLVADPVPLETLAPSAPRALSGIVMKCLARDKSLRWRDARELKEALVRVGGPPREAIPEPLRDLPSFGPYALLWALAWSAFALLTVRSSVGERVLLLLIALLVPVGLLLHVWNVGRHGLDALELARVVSWPPEWWGMWWPRALRRPSDIWPRLPWPARATRVALSAFFVAIPTLIVLRQWLVATGRIAGDVATLERFLVVESLVVAGAALIVAMALWWSRRRGLSLEESVRVLFGATTGSSLWETPRIAALLAPRAGRVQPPVRDSAADHRRAFAELMQLQGRAPRDAAAVATLADRIVRLIHECDGEIASLHRDASPENVDRLSAQLAELGDPAASELPERRDLRDLLQRQIDIMQRMRARHDALSQHRARVFDVLRGMWTQLCEACEKQDTDSRDARLRDLCRDITAELERLSPAGLLYGSPRVVPAAAPPSQIRRYS